MEIKKETGDMAEVEAGSELSERLGIPTICDACGRGFSKWNELIGVSIEVKTETKNSALTEIVKAQMLPYETNRTYRVCFPCWLKSLGIKPKNA